MSGEKKQIKRIGIAQTSKVAAAMYLVISLVFVVPIFLFTSIFAISTGKSDGVFGLIFIFVFPLFYAGIGYAIVALSSWIYNLVAKRVGGIELYLG